MKRSVFLLFVLLPFLANSIGDSLSVKKKDRIKRGWNVGPIPVLAFDSDLGFEYGAVLNFFNYGDGSTYPEYRHSIYTEASWYTKGSDQYRLIYDSKYAVRGVRVIADFQYLKSLAADFYGFNGAESRYHKSWTEEQSADYRSNLFYKMNKDLLRVGADFLGTFEDKRFGWVLGTSLQKFDVGPLKLHKLDLVPSPNHDASDVLYDKYVRWGVIKSWERRGGTHLGAKAGLVFDTRDNEPNPMRGVWIDALLTYMSPNLAAEGRGHAKLSLSFRKYFTLIPNDLSFAFRLMTQNVIAGTCPFYLNSQIVTVSPRHPFFEGLGGAYSLRGMLRSRVVANGFALANAEFRYKFWRLYLFRQNFYLAATTFIDAGMITQKTGLDLSGVDKGDYDSYFRDVTQRPHYTYGVGGKLVMNQNFVISGDIGKPFSKDDGDLGLYIGLNFLF